MTTQPLPQAAYTLPEWVDTELQILHADLIARMRDDIQTMGGFGTVNEMLAERVVFNYIILKSKEVAAVGQPGGWTHERNQKEFNTFWLATVQELNRIATRPDASKIKDALNEQIAGAIAEAVADVPSELRNQISERLLLAIEGVEVP